MISWCQRATSLLTSIGNQTYEYFHPIVNFGQDCIKFHFPEPGANAQTVRCRNPTNAGVVWRSQDAVRRWRRASLRTSALSITLGLKCAASIIGSLKLLL